MGTENFGFSGKSVRQLSIKLTPTTVVVLGIDELMKGGEDRRGPRSGNLREHDQCKGQKEEDKPAKDVKDD